MADEPREIRLPDNAFRELEEGERYEPVVSAGENPPEITVYSVAWGLIMTVVFAAVSTYIILRLGQGIEAAIPIAILTIGVAALLRIKGALLQNVSVLAIGATSGIVAGGSVFVMPAIFIERLDDLSGFFQIFVVPLLGAVLGVLFLIPFRRHFVAEMHGKLPFPEATATTEVLITGERGGKQARTLVLAMGIGGLFDGVVEAFRLWSTDFTTKLVPLFSTLTHKVKAIFAMNCTAAIAGLGYLIGVRYAMIITAGSLLGYWVLVPMIAHFGAATDLPISPGTVPIREMDAETIWLTYPRLIGIGGIVTAGIISILQMSGTIGQAVRTAVREVLKRGDGDESAENERTDRDIPMSRVIAMIVGTVLVIWFYFRFSVLAGMEGATGISLVAVALTVLIAFLFAAVSAWAVAMISVTPISGMTLMTLILSAVLMAQLGLKGREGMLATLLIGGVVCTALSMAATLVTEFKISYWLGATPKKIQWANILGSIVAALAVTGVMFLIAHTTGFDDVKKMPAPQARAMAEVVSGVLGTGTVPWFLYAIGAAIVIIVEAMGISGLAFALGMYIPIEYNTPIVVGAVVAWLVKRSSKKEHVAHRRYERGILFSSGLIAGGALMAILVLILGLAGVPLKPTSWPGPQGKNYLAAFMFLALCGYMYWDARQGAKESDPAPDGGSE